MKISHKILTPFLFCKEFLGCRQPLARIVQVVIALAKFDEHFPQGNQVLNLIAQSPSMLAAQFVKFSPLFIGHADIESEIFLCHSFYIAKAAP
jgi:hypothetical protein